MGGWSAFAAAAPAAARCFPLGLGLVARDAQGDEVLEVVAATLSARDHMVCVELASVRNADKAALLTGPVVAPKAGLLEPAGDGGACAILPSHCSRPEGVLCGGAAQERARASAAVAVLARPCL